MEDLWERGNGVIGPSRGRGNCNWDILFERRINNKKIITLIEAIHAQKDKHGAYGY